MNVSPLISEARANVEHRLPRHISFNDIVDSCYQEIVEVVAEKVHFALEQAMLGAQSTLKTQADEYIAGLKINDDLTIGIDDKVKYLEDGYGRWHMLDNLLTGPKAKVSKSGDLYNIIPLGKSDASKVRRSMSQKAKEVISSGAMSGVSRRTLSNIVDSMTDTLKMASDVKSQEPKGFATASSKQDADTSWVHPGFDGVHQLDQINAQLKTDLLESIVAIIEDRAWRMT